MLAIKLCILILNLTGRSCLLSSFKIQLNKSEIVAYWAYSVKGFHRATCENTDSEDSRYLVYQDIDNVTRVIDLHEAPQYELLRRASSKHQYLLFTRQNHFTAQTLIMNDSSTLRKSNFNPGLQTIVIVHGWRGNKDSECNSKIRDVYLNKMSVNVIVMYWSSVGDLNYVSASLGVPAAGRALGAFVGWVCASSGASARAFHLLGYSLGAHLAACAGRARGGNIARITGLDPAGPLWHTNSNRLTKSDAAYVEGIHTNQILLGIKRTVGDVDFYPNGGNTQPGCTTDECSHSRSYQFFAATVQYNHLIGHKCSDVISLELDLCFGYTLRMGNEDLFKYGDGLFRVRVKEDYPY